MEIKQLKQFVAVVELGNISRAADLVALSQPALTRSIKMLENSLGVRLLERLPRGVIVTAAGREFYKNAKLILSECKRSLLEAKSAQAGDTGSVTVGIAAMFSDHVIDVPIAQFASDHPSLTLSIHEGFFEELVSQLADGKFDFVFTNFPEMGALTDLVFEPLLEITTSVVVGSQHPLASQRSVSKHELRAARWVVVNQPHMDSLFHQMFALDGLPLPNNTIHVDSLTLIESLLVHGEYVSILADSRIASRVKSGELRRLKVPLPRIVRKAGLIYRRSSHLRPPVHAFMDALRTACSKQQSTM
jgi:DNA-binding transcriptional LysR family regulator